MAIQFIPKFVTIPSGTRRRTLTGFVTFPANVRGAAVTLKGFKLDFDNAAGSNRPINIVEVRIGDVRVLGSTVEFDVECLYADYNFDDRYSGYVEAQVIADVA